VLTCALAVRLIFAGTRCTGVEVSVGGRAGRIEASEVILAAGAFDTPKLLMLSGIGDPDELQRVGIAVAHALPGVGRNLRDHPLMAGLLFQTKRPVPVSHYNHAESMIVTQSSRTPGWADLQLIGLSVPYVLPHLGKAPENGFSIVPANMHPRSRGQLKIISDDPRTPPVIDPAYLAEQADVDVLVEVSGSRARSRIALRSATGSPTKCFPGRRPKIGRRWKRMCARAFRRSTIRSRPAAWGAPTMRWPWLTRIAAFMGSPICASSMPPFFPRSRKR
jgi:choline dehydrogenase-like flavoprotein